VKDDDPFSGQNDFRLPTWSISHVEDADNQAMLADPARWHNPNTLMKKGEMNKLGEQ
jgi:hypothetical protein